MIHKLTDNIWWGDRHSPKEAGESVGLILCLAHNIDDDKYNPLKLPMKPIYVRIAIPDEVKADAKFFKAVDAMHDLSNPGRLPILVHCFAGQHRSPNVAIYLATRYEAFNPEAYHRLRTRAFQLEPHIDMAPMGRSVDNEIRRRCGIGA